MKNLKKGALEGLGVPEQDEFTKFLMSINLKNLGGYIGRVVLIDWRDAHHDHISDWMTVDELEFPDTCIQSIGFLVKEDEHHIMLASTMCRSDQNVCGFFTITKGQILNIRIFEEETNESDNAA